jgi:predicted Zn finger-like uncharacterized protein
MFTVCPKCALTLVVTAADLRVAQGYVRCGRCSSVFNALARLTDDRQAFAAGEAETESSAEDPGIDTVSSTASPQARSPAPSPESDDLTDDALEFDPTRTDAAAVFVEQPPDPQWTAATGSVKARIAANQAPAREPPPDDSQVDVEIDADFLASMLQDSDDEGARRPADPSREPAEGPLESAAPAPAPQSPVPAAPGRPTAPRSGEPPTGSANTPPPASATRQTPAASTQPRGVAAGNVPRPSPRHGAPHMRPPEAAVKTPPLSARLPASSEAAPRTPPHTPSVAAEPTEPTNEAEAVEAGREAGAGLLEWLRPHGLRIGVALTAVVLLAQIVNHYRDALATSASLNRPLTALYAALGVKLTPHWDLRAYDVRQLGASVDPGGAGRITVRASIKNAAPQPQPLPLLRVTLQDRFGNRIAARDVAPRFYLPHNMPESSYLSGGQRIDAEMGFVDPGANAVGFEIDACLPASGGGVNCANDASAR